MNVNEVISNIAIEAAGGQIGSKTPVHPNDHVNKSQSTNDAFPAAMHIATVLAFKNQLLPELEKMVDVLDGKSQEWKDIIKLGRTHMQDACPLSLGQEVSGWRDQIKFAAKRIDECLEEVYALPLGGTAVGSGLNTPKGFAEDAAAVLADLTNQPFTSSPNKFQTMGSHDCLVAAMGQLRNLSVSLFKIANDIRLLSCGPRAGFGELILPENEPGSSIMPGKVNPTQCEAMAMVCSQVMGFDAAVSVAGSGGYLEMNVYKPLMIYNISHSVDMLTDSCRCFREQMLEGMEPNLPRIEGALKDSLMLVTALAPTIGYDKASEIAHLGHEKGLSLKDAALETGYVTEEQFDTIVDPYQMAFPHGVPDKV
jgi:fumarate hydratase class II